MPTACGATQRCSELSALRAVPLGPGGAGGTFVGIRFLVSWWLQEGCRPAAAGAARLELTLEALPPCPLVMETGCQVNRVNTAVPTGLKQSVVTPVATPQEDDVPSLGLLLLPGPLKGPVVTAGGSSSGLEEKDHPIERQEESSNHVSVLELPSEERVNRLVGSPKFPVLEPTTGTGSRVRLVDPARN